jgi:hypothetical protein
MLESEILQKASALHTMIAAAAPDYPRAIQIQIGHELLIAIRNNDWDLANHFIGTYQNEGILGAGFGTRFLRLMGGVRNKAATGT